MKRLSTTERGDEYSILFYGNWQQLICSQTVFESAGQYSADHAGQSAQIFRQYDWNRMSCAVSSCITADLFICSGFRQVYFIGFMNTAIKSNRSFRIENRKNRTVLPPVFVIQCKVCGKSGKGRCLNQ